MPLTPAILPVSAISITADRPISAPPRRDAIGVKAVAVIEQGPRLGLHFHIEVRPGLTAGTRDSYHLVDRRDLIKINRFVLSNILIYKT